MTLPGQVECETAGRFVLVAEGTGVPVGRFAYGKNFLLANPDIVPIDPLDLKLSTGTYRTTNLDGMFGAQRDSSPDYRGWRVIERHAGRARLGEIDYLIHAPGDRAGALGFDLGPEPPAPRHEFNKTLDLDELLTLADAVIADEEIEDGSEARQAEAFCGSVRQWAVRVPRHVVEDMDGLWVVKFNRPDDRWNHARAEHAMLELAKACGLTTSHSRVETVGDRDVLLVKRFDREKSVGGFLRARMISSLTILRAEDTHQQRDHWSYVLPAEELRRICSDPARETAEPFRRMVFNTLISNSDDHPRNHAATAKDWRLSPAYDLRPSMPLSLERRDIAMNCGDLSRYAHAENLLSQCARIDVERNQARAIIDATEMQVAGTWYETARLQWASSYLFSGKPV